MDEPRFVQIVGYKGHFRRDYWKYAPGTAPPDFHEYAQEEPAAEAIAGETSPLYIDAPLNPIDKTTTSHVPLTLGIKPWGGMSLLLTKDTFKAVVMPRAGMIDRTHQCISPYPPSDYLSLSPISFRSKTELVDMLKLLRPKKAGQKGRDDSKLNNGFTESKTNRGRGEFEQARLFWYAQFGKRHDLLPMYGLPPLPSNLRIAYLAHTPWIDPNTFRIMPNEEEQSLDIGWYEPATEKSRHFILEEYEGMKKNSLPKAEFEHGESNTIPETSLSANLISLITSTSSNDPLVLVTHDWPRTARLLKSQNIDTNGPNWHIGIGELLGLERRTNPPRHPNGGDGRKGNGEYHARNKSTSENTHRAARINDPDHYGKVKPEPKEEKPKFYDGRYDSSSPVRDRKRSLSPRARTRPLEDKSERKYQRPIFQPDSDSEKEPGELSSSPVRRSTPVDPIASTNPSATALPHIFVLDIRPLFASLLNSPEPRQFTIYPPLARRLGFSVDGWCAGNQAVQMHAILEFLVGGEPIHRRQEELRSQPGLPAPVPPSGIGQPALLEGVAAGATPGVTERSQQSFMNEWNEGSSDEDDGW